MYTTLKTTFQKLLEDTIAREKQAPVGAFPSDEALAKHRGVLHALDGCLNSFKQECQNIENEHANGVEDVIPIVDTPPQVTEGEIVA